MIVDEIAPESLGQKRIGLSLSAQTQRPRVGELVIVDVDLSGTEPEGVVLPLIFTVTNPDGSKLMTTLIELAPPDSLTFQPEGSGRFLVRLGETFHNRWWGSLVVEVVGDALEQAST